ncbi:hypothetical protein K438DRAFT_1864619 [Mycena galopus ATCC 62051]|nr:hypothetical protein K438DRAFT_1864619 [Mycena galopus ATCC 62051]
MAPHSALDDSSFFSSPDALLFTDSAPLSLPSCRKCIKPRTSYLQSSLEQHPP